MNLTQTRMYCEVNSAASIQWKRYFHELHFGFNHFTIRCLFSGLLPTGAIIVFNSYVICHLAGTYRHLHRTYGHRARQEQARTKLYMNIVLVLHNSLFLGSLISHMIGHFAVVEARETWWVLLAVLINCSLNFYLYCLSGQAFRNEIHRFIQRSNKRLFPRARSRQQ